MCEEINLNEKSRDNMAEKCIPRAFSSIIIFAKILKSDAIL